MKKLKTDLWLTKADVRKKNEAKSNEKNEWIKKIEKKKTKERMSWTETRKKSEGNENEKI